MRKNIFVLSALATILMPASVFAAIPNQDDPKTYLGTTIHGTYADLFSDKYQYAINAVGGVNEQRLGLAGGYKADEFQRFKVYLEFLKQDIGYAFFSGNTHQGIYEMDGNFRYQYKYQDMKFKPNVDIAGYMAHTTNATLRVERGTYYPGGVATPFTNARRIAGAFSTGLLADFGMQLWEANATGLEINYDNVRYDMEYESNVNSAGLGAGLYMNQIFKDFFQFSLAAGWRQPFNYYSVDAGFTNIHKKGTWSIGGEWDYVRGKDTLPTTFTVGLVVNYWPEMCNEKTLADRMQNNELLRWIQKPAVAMPQVLAIADERTT